VAVISGHLIGTSAFRRFFNDLFQISENLAEVNQNYVLIETFELGKVKD